MAVSPKSTETSLDVVRTDVHLAPDPRRVLFRPFEPASEQQCTKVYARVCALTDLEVKETLAEVLAQFKSRHVDLAGFMLKRYREAARYALTDMPLTEERQLLIGAYFTQEFSLESSALFNPSMVWHPDQSALEPGSRRFILSLRALGESHQSSITLRAGVVDADGSIRVDSPTRYAVTPEVHPNPIYDKALFEKKLYELGLLETFTREVISELSESFTLKDLDEAANQRLRHARSGERDYATLANGIMGLARANYEISFPPDQVLSERIIYPTTRAERKGLEDARFVEFRDEQGERTYYATYTAFDGEVFFPQLLETRDFLQFKISTLNGPAVQNKGLALFPRKINGHYAMLSRQDNENMYIMFSDMLHFWYTKNLLMRPTYPWECVQVGNCGSPIETDAGWLVLTHGVGAMRKYAIGAILLDLHDPARVIGRLREPLLSPDDNEREGYVPNVVYSCGAAIHGGQLIVPYAMSDYASGIATVGLDSVLEILLRNGPDGR
jgi:predicted GH43/DUF377 family glycosyl hydrolase